MRYSAPVTDLALPADMPDAPLDQLLRTRHSCRGFLPDPVAPATLDWMLETAQRTPSWCNSQPWRVIITRGAATDRFRDAITAHANPQPGTSQPFRPATPDYPFPREYRGVYLDRRRDCGFSLYRSVGVQRGDHAAGDRQRVENYRLFGAPHVAIVTTDEALGVYGVLDCGAWVNNFMLAGHSRGVASIAQAALAAYPDFLREYFGLGADRRVVCGIAFGHEDTAHPANSFRTPRAPIADAVTWVDD